MTSSSPFTDYQRRAIVDSCAEGAEKEREKKRREPFRPIERRETFPVPLRSSFLPFRCLSDAQGSVGGACRGAEPVGVGRIAGVNRYLTDMTPATHGAAIQSDTNGPLIYLLNVYAYKFFA